MSLVRSAWRKSLRSAPVSSIVPRGASVTTADSWAAAYCSRENICYSDGRVKFLRHFTVIAGLVAAAGSHVTQDAAAQSQTANTFRVFLRGAEAGIEEVTLLASPDGWTLRGSGKLRAPVNLSMDYWEARYDRAWKPIELTINLTDNNNRWTVRTSFKDTVASSEIAQNGQMQRRTNTVAPDAVVLPNLIFGASEALAARLSTARVGSQ